MNQGIKSQQIAPFLIMGQIPHLTKIIKNNWNNPELALTDIQKERLSIVHKNTIGSVMKLKKEIIALEREVAKATKSGATPQSLKAKVDQIAKLKAEATMTHITCIYETKNILAPKQLEILSQLKKPKK